MGHARRRLVEEVVALLINLPETGANVFEDPASSVSDTTLPALIVETAEENVETLGEIPRNDDGYVQLRRLSITVTCVTKSIESREQSSSEVEEAIMRSSVGDMRRLDRISFDSSADGNFRLWLAGLTFELTYQTQSDYPRVAIR